MLSSFLFPGSIKVGLESSEKEDENIEINELETILKEAEYECKDIIPKS